MRKSVWDRLLRSFMLVSPMWRLAALCERWCAREGRQTNAVCTGYSERFGALRNGKQASSDSAGVSPRMA